MSTDDYGSPVYFNLLETPTQHFFTPNPAQPSCIVTLLLERVSEQVEPATHTLNVIATGASVPSVTRQLAITYRTTRPEPEERESWLYLETTREKIKLGDATLLHGQLVPVTESVEIVLNFSLANGTIVDGTFANSWTEQVHTNALGIFRYLFTPPQTGRYRIFARWPGNSALDPSTSNDVALETLPKTSKISLKVKHGPYFTSGKPLHFLGSTNYVDPTKSATAEVTISYLGSLQAEHRVVSVTTEGYAGSFDLTGTGLARLRAKWWGYPPSILSAESPPVMIYVYPSGQSPRPQTLLPVLDPGVCLLIAGATSAELPTETRDFLGNFSYYVLKNRRFNHMRLFYVNNNPQQDYDWDGKDDEVVDFEESSIEAVQQGLQAAGAYVSDSSPVSLFIVAEKGDGNGLRMGDGSILTASDLDQMLIGNLGQDRDLRILIEASNSGAFCEALWRSNRTVISSARSENASYMAGGLLSFSQIYWTKVQEGWGVQDSFAYARDYIQATFGYYGSQTPVLWEPTDYEMQYLYYGLSTDATDMLSPDIEGIFEPIVLEGTDKAEIYAWATDDIDVASVKAAVWKPDGSQIELTLAQETEGSRKYSTVLKSFQTGSVLDQLGVYDISIVAMDTARNVSEPKNSQIVVVSSFDLNQDSRVDAQDLLLLLVEMGAPASLCDFTGDNQLTAEDLFEFTRFWHSACIDN